MRARIEEGVVYSPHPYSPLAHDLTFYGFLMERLAVHGSRTALRAFILGKRRSGFDSVHEFCGDDEVLYEYEGLDSSGASFVEWTTGTTGPSKGVEIPQDRFLRKVSCLVGVEMLSAKDVLLGDCNISSYIAFFLWIVALHHGSTIAISRTCHTVPLDLFDVIKNIEIIDEVSQEVLGPMQRGEVLVNTPYAAAWYCGCPAAATDIMDEQGWLHTGDLGYYDHYGRLFLCGRLKTMLVCQTRKVAPVEIEHCLLEHAAVEEVAVLGVPAPDGEEFPAAVVVTKRGRSQDQELANDLKSFVAERTPSFMHLHGGVYFADALRKNTRGKVWLTAFRELLGTLSRMDSVDENAPGECIY
ncbi:hypothetical protein HPB50_019545 [Hyalomma asiaticum]|uniref:Uncharacterized protein n=1 Tax=Hyalomma asiaticum TaxID=266040 RepID=A0ACB7SWI0_HYAAI|nr:hypothetical protein HPB50_019545 [Hyalomma asiaticum]